MTLGFRVLSRERKVDAEAVRRFADVPVACVSDVMSRLSGGGPRLRPFHAGGGMAGPALTVRVRPGDNLMIHKALMLAEPGDVIVVDGGGELSNALMGELMLSYAAQRKVAGVVINGAIRDSRWIKSQSLPVFAAGISHRGPYKDGPGEINAPVALDGMVVAPGDLVLGDDDGLVCVPLDGIDEVYRLARSTAQAETKVAADTAAGRLASKAWVDEALRRLGCEGL